MYSLNEVTAGYRCKWTQYLLRIKDTRITKIVRRLFGNQFRWAVKKNKKERKIFY
jgi:hypothetical protein